MLHTDERYLVWVAFFVIASSFTFALNGLVIKFISAGLNTETIFFFRNLFAVLILLPWLQRAGLAALKTRYLGLHLIRSGAGVGAMFCYFFAVGHIALGDAVLLNFTAPLFVPLFAFLWIGERLILQIAYALLIGFAGTALIVKPGTALFSPEAIVGLLGGAFGGLATVAIARMAPTEPSTRIVFYFSTVALVLSAIPLPWRWQTPDLGQLGLLLTVGLLGTLAQLLFTRGCVVAPVRKVNPLVYTSVAFALLFGWLFFQEIPDTFSTIGVAFVCLGGVLAIRKPLPRAWGKVR